MTTTITRTYDNVSNARSVVSELKAINVAEADISVIAHDEHHDTSSIDTETTNGTANGASNGAGIGGMVGGAAGLLAGLGLIAIPGVGPLVAAGWLATTAAGAATGAVAGAATGSIVSAMTDAGVDHRDAETYAEAVRRGAILISVRTSDDNDMRVTAIMDRNNPSDLTARRAWWETDGWSSHDPAAAPFSREERMKEQQRWS